MKYSIDYLSFTIPCDTLQSANAHLLGALTEQVVMDFLGDKINALLDDQPFTVLRGRAPYAASWGRADGGVRFFSSPSIAHVLVEVSGTGCKTLRAHEALQDILALVADKVSRIDLAVDIECAVKPHEFAERRDVARFKALGDIRSDTGDTFYVGSWKSERFARVYRYAEPHPRAKTLRVEHVFRKKAAKAFAKGLLKEGYDAAVAACGRVYGWSHDVWQANAVEPMELVSGQVRKTNKNTVNWLYGAVSNSVVKMVTTKQLDLEAYIEHLRELVDKATN